MPDNSKETEVVDLDEEPLPPSSPFAPSSPFLDAGTQTSPFDTDADEIPLPSSASRPRRPQTPPLTPRVPSLNPSSGSKRRQKPKDVFLGTWKRSGLHPAISNAVYSSHDRRGHINRRISKERHNGQVVIDGNFDTRKTACRHENINYIAKCRGMSRLEVGCSAMNCSW